MIVEYNFTEPPGNLIQETKYGPEIFSREGCDWILDTALQLLDKVGIQIVSAEEDVLSLLQGYGAKITLSKSVTEAPFIRLSPNLVWSCLESLPSSLTLCGLNGSQSVCLKSPGTSPPLYTTSSGLPFILDSENGETRNTQETDTAELVRLTDQLAGISVVMSCAVQPVGTDRALLKTAVNTMLNTRKPVYLDINCVEDLLIINDLVNIFRKEYKAPNSVPSVGFYIGADSPWRWQANNLDLIIEAVRNGFFIVPYGNGATGLLGPADPKFGFPQVLAESMFGTVVGVLAAKEAGIEIPPIIPAVNMSPVKLAGNLSLSYNTLTSWQLADVMLNQISVYFAECTGKEGFLTQGTAGCSDASEIDFLAGQQIGSSIVASEEIRSSLVHDVGVIGGGKVYSSEALILADMCIREARYNASLPLANGTKLATRALRTSLREGSFLGTRQTARAMRAGLSPSLSETSMPDKIGTIGSSLQVPTSVVDYLEQIFSDYNYD